MATPFRSDDETVDFDSFGKAVRFMKRAGVDGVTIVGVLGESNRLLDTERSDIIRAAVQSAEDMPVFVGTSHPGTKATAVLSEKAEELGASGVMITPSREPTPMDETRLIEYFRAIDSAISIPIILQDHPASTQVHMSVSTMATLVEEIPAISCVKLESLPSPPRISALKKSMKSRGCSATILTGLGALYGAFDLEEGADGFMTGFAFPEALKALVEYSATNTDKMFEIYQHWLPLLVFEQQPGLAVRKEVYRLRGLLDSSHVRHPGGNIGGRASESLRLLIKRTLPGIDVSKPIDRSFFT